MQQKTNDAEHHKRRSEFIRELVQRTPDQRAINNRFKQETTPKTIVQFWHDLGQLPADVEECVRSWTFWETSGFRHQLFDQSTAAAFINRSLGTRYARAFERCYHPAMLADYFRLCYVLIEGGIYVDADDVCTGNDIGWLADDCRLKLQPLCYDVGSEAMVKPDVFLRAGAYDPNWIFYFNNNPLIAGPGHPVIEYALKEATRVLELAGKDELPEIQMATGPGNISRALFDLRSKISIDAEDYLVILRNWESFAPSQWPLSYRGDARNWRLSNRKRFLSVADRT